MSCPCKGCKPTSEIKTFDPYLKQKILNDEKLCKSQRMVPGDLYFFRMAVSTELENKRDFLNRCSINFCIATSANETCF